MSNNILTVMNQLDSTTYNHSVRVMMIAAEVEEYLKITDHKLIAAALFHDVGKLYIPYNILDKNSRLTHLEREIIDLHPYIGYCILTELGIDEDICRIVLYHHGPRPLTIRDVGYYDKKEIYEYANILHTIDAFEALTSDRPYHRGLPVKEALDILIRETGYDYRTLEYITLASEQTPSKDSAIYRTKARYEDDFIENLLEGIAV